jgi:hypothetical protein
MQPEIKRPGDWEILGPFDLTPASYSPIINRVLSDE